MGCGLRVAGCGPARAAAGSPSATRIPHSAALLVVMRIQSALDPAGPQAQRLADLFWIFFWVSAVVYVVVIAFLIAAMMRGRRNAAADPEDRHPQKVAVGTAVALTALILIGLLTMSAATGGKVGTFGQGRNPMEIDVTGHEWWWEVKYPDANVPSHTIVDANEIHIPTGTPVLLRLDTRDVIHSLWIPNLHGKRDLIPGRVNKIWIQADKAGIYRGQCAEFCGMQHANMVLTVFAQSPVQFEFWKSSASMGGAKPATAQQEKGRQLFLSLPCANCHNILGEEAYGTLGPDLTHIASRRTLAAGTLMNTPGNMAGWISNSQAIKPGNQMPPNVMSADELQALLAYLENLK